MTTHTQSFPIQSGITPEIIGDSQWLGVTVVTNIQASEITCELRSRNMSSEQMLEHVRIWQEGETVRFSVDPRIRFFPFGSNISLHITVPVETNIKIAARSGSTTLEGNYGDVSLESSSGSVRIDTARRTRARTTSGSIRLNASGNTCAQTTSGSITAGLIAGNYQLQSTSGSIKVESLDGEGSAKSTSGSIKVISLRGSLQAGATSGSLRIGALYEGRLDAHTVSGSQTIGIAPGTAALVNANARSGAVQTNLEPTDPETSSRTATVEARATSGRIRLVRAD